MLTENVEREGWLAHAQLVMQAPCHRSPQRPEPPPPAPFPLVFGVPSAAALAGGAAGFFSAPASPVQAAKGNAAVGAAAAPQNCKDKGKGKGVVHVQGAGGEVGVRILISLLLLCFESECEENDAR